MEKPVRSDDYGSGEGFVSGEGIISKTKGRLYV